MLPKLDLDFRLWYPGQSGKRFFYLNNNPLTGIIVDTIEGNRLDSFDDIFKGRYRNWEVRLTLDIPLKNIFSQAGLARAKIEEDQRLVEQEKLNQTIHYEVLDAIKTLKHSRNRIKSTARYRELMEQRLDAEEQRYELGLVSNEWLLQYQRQLTSAKAQEVSALTNYKIAVARLEKAMGTNLSKKNIHFRDYDF
jgi:outer membrane protein TolC